MERECGTCYACCVWLDITALKKKGMRPCKYLSHRKPAARCTIYARRPEACSGYLCSWMGGLFDDDMRPDQSGLLVTMYEDEQKPGYFMVTINITNGSKCGTFEEGPLSRALYWLFARMHHISRVNLLNRRNNSVIEFSDGNIWECHLMKGTKLESLEFIRLKIVGHYHSADSESDIPPEAYAKGSVILRPRTVT